MICWPDNVPIITIIYNSYRFKNRVYYVTYTKNKTIVIILLTRRVFFSNIIILMICFLFLASHFLFLFILIFSTHVIYIY